MNRSGLVGLWVTIVCAASAPAAGPEVVWKYDTAGCVLAPPAVAGDLVFVGACSGTFYALDRATGTPRWSYDVRLDGKQTSIHGAILIDDDKVLFGADKGCATDGIGHVYAADRRSGQIEWRYRSPVGVSANLVRTRSSVCFGTTFDDWGCLDPRSGLQSWKEPLAAPAECALPKWSASDGQRLFVIGSNGAIVALRAADGTVLWQRALAARATTSPIVADGIVHVGAADDRLYALDAASGRVLRSVYLEDRPVGRLEAARTGLFVLTEDAQQRGALIALDADGRRVRWRREHPRTFASEQPHVWRDVVVVGDCNGAVIALSVADGAPRWQTTLTGCLRSVGSSAELLYFGTEQGMVYALRP